MASQKTPAPTGNDRLRIYLAHFAHHLAEHLDDLTHHRVTETEPAELKRLLDEAAASIEVSHKAIEDALVHLGSEGGVRHFHDHGHGEHHHHHHGGGAHSHD